MSAKKKIETLRAEIRRHERLYYVDAAPEISDYEFDQLMRELKELEEMHPELASDDSPTARVGGAPNTEFPPAPHDPPMLSIENAYSHEELEEWHARVCKGLETDAVEYATDLKIDGLSIDLIYEGGRLVRGATRGDGATGDDVTANIRTIRSLPLVVDFGKRLHVRGEAFLDKDQFAALNQRREEEGEPPFANPRNAAAGSHPHEELPRGRGEAAERLSLPARPRSHGRDPERGGSRFRPPPELSGESRAHPLSARRADREVHREVAGEAPRASVRDRRDRGQGEPVRSAGRARRDFQSAALGDRLEVSRPKPSGPS
jgi:hypothetical protein